MQCQVGPWFLSNSFLMYSAMSFSMLCFSNACPNRKSTHKSPTDEQPVNKGERLEENQIDRAREGGRGRGYYDAGNVEGLLPHILLHVRALELDLVPRPAGRRWGSHARSGGARLLAV